MPVDFTESIAITLGAIMIRLQRDALTPGASVVQTLAYGIAVGAIDRARQEWLAKRAGRDE